MTKKYYKLGLVLLILGIVSDVLGLFLPVRFENIFVETGRLLNTLGIIIIGIFLVLNYNKSKK
ncbi:hypothetical protein HMPREF9318_01185 [Streptococcus urinalis FB127-CNA-2]|uniref:Uncharacterized protein n=1 Tax=Streptococcus urinalis 2285-97 TaxID=764291 RepID=G5KI59_9STRE|nr:hypothetical protein [Streptococcus urinalis]EHJ56174.1 hypothetical protein STRUR_0341 [Streptococcus urinalis 2285-97]EKS20547.1 hypothetical protein HMPREF9318_01185 [Streptococcus urinalis FB127-CNA-2]VEF31240.1 Uncharacterised protein [Streptococcus urinalis]